MNKEHRSRLYREISKYEADPRFNRFMLVAECTYEEFLTYVPEIFVYTQESADATIYKNLIKYFKRFYKIHILPHQIKRGYSGLGWWITAGGHQINIVIDSAGAHIHIDGVMRETLIRKKNEYGKFQYFVRRGATEASKVETINSLETKIQISFVGSRARAVEKIPGLIRQSIIKNYTNYINNID